MVRKVAGLATYVLITLTCGLVAAQTDTKSVVHDAEYYILAAQNGERWHTEDRAIDQRLAEFREKNGGKPPNIFYILIDDIGFGDLGSETLNSIRGYKTPSINKLAREGMRLSRMYTEPS